MTVDDRIQILAEELHKLLLINDNILPITKFLSRVEMIFENSWMTKPMVHILNELSRILKDE